ncbi:hypothetical protein HY933_02520 [Candidatus Falkowbacteria bacterium]|nr:hypothetical protein [Candidatus Falkowbacteria bacterium]
MLYTLKKFCLRHRVVIISLTALVLVGVVVLPQIASAQGSPEIVANRSAIGEFLARQLAYLLSFVVALLGKLVLVMVVVLVKIAQYGSTSGTSFIDATAVKIGWVVVRDMANMFFVVVLLIIAFATILKIEEYNYKHLLPKVLLMAILVNFSKTICGIAIDLAQVVMLTFVNGFKDTGAGNFINATGLPKTLKFSVFATPEELAANVSQSAVAASYMLALIYIVIILVVLVVNVLILAFRIVMLWVLVVLSPLFFLMLAFPGGQGYAKEWSQEFVKYLVSGPLLAFFLWLSLSMFGTLRQDLVQTVPGMPAEDISGTTPQLPDNPQAGITQAGTWDHVIQFVIAISMLVGGLTITGSLGGAMSTFAGGGLSKLKSAGMGTLKGAAGVASWGERKWTAKTGIPLNPFRMYRDIKEGFHESAAKDETRAIIKVSKTAHGLIGSSGGVWGGVKSAVGIGLSAVGAGKTFVEDYTGYYGVKRVLKTIFRPADAAKFAAEAAEMKEKEKLETAQFNALKDDSALTEAGKDQIKDSVLTKDATKILSAGGKKFTPEELEAKKEELTKDENIMKIISEKIAKATPDQLKQNGQMKLSADMAKNMAIMGQLKGISADEGTRGKRLGAIVSELEQLNKTVAGQHGGPTVTQKTEKERLEKEQAQIKQYNGLAQANELSGLALKGGDAVAAARHKEAAEKYHQQSVAAKSRITTFSTYYADQARRALEAEELKKMPSDAMEAEEVTHLTREALHRKDKVAFTAMFKKAAEDYNDNEILNGFGYESGPEGMKKFRREVMMKELGMGDQESMAVLNEINYINEKKGHYNTSRMYGFSQGRYRERSAEEQAAIVASELLKASTLNFWRNTNRLGLGYEDANGKFKLDITGKLLLSATQEDFLGRVEKGDVNVSMLRKLYEDIDSLKDMVSKGKLRKDVVSAIEKRIRAQGLDDKGTQYEVFMRKAAGFK